MILVRDTSAIHPFMFDPPVAPDYKYNRLRCFRRRNRIGHVAHIRMTINARASGDSSAPTRRVVRG